MAGSVVQDQQTADQNTGPANTPKAMLGASLKTAWAIFFADAGNTADVYIGPTNTASLYPVAKGDWYLLEMPREMSAKGYTRDLATWYVKSTADNQVYRISYLTLP